MNAAAAAALALCAATACGASVGAPNGQRDATGSADARGSADAAGGSDASTDALGLCPNHRSLFLEFQGVTLTKAATSDATQDLASWIGESDASITTATVPPYHDGSPTRDSDIDSIVSQVAAYFPDDHFDIVVDRPATGPYVMVALGGSNAPLGVAFSIATATLDCHDAIKSDVAWVSDSTPIEKVPGYIVGAVGYGLGLTATEDPNDCMCGWGAGTCTQPDTPCSLSASIVGDNRCGGSTQDEVAQFATEFCQ